MKWRLASVVIICWLIAGMVVAAPRSDSQVAPQGDPMRAYNNISDIVRGPWVSGDWAVRVILESGRGRERVEVPMTIIGGWSPEEGRWQRIKLASGDQWIIKGKLAPQVWLLTDGSSPRGQKPLDDTQMLGKINERIPLSWDLYTMRFLSWQSKNYLGVERLRGRWCDGVELRGGPVGGYARAVVWLDSDFGVPMEVNLYDKENRHLKTLRAVSLQKVDNQWFLKRWEVVDVVTGAKVAVETIAVAFGQAWEAGLRDERKSSDTWPTIPPQAWREIE